MIGWAATALAGGPEYEFPDIPEVVGVVAAWEVTLPEVVSGVAPPGTNPEVVLRWVNPHEAPVHIPANPFADVFVFAHHVTVTEGPRRAGDGLGYGAVAADALSWVVVGPGQAVEHRARLSRWDADCVGGCAPGTWDVTISDPRPLAGGAPDQWKPALEGSASFAIQWPSEPAPSGAWTARLVPRGSRTRVVLRNTSDAALWVPRVARHACEWRQPGGGGGATREADPGTSNAFDEAGATRVRPGASLTLPVRCAIPRDATLAVVELVPVGELWATRVHPDEPVLRWIASPIRAE